MECKGIYIVSFCYNLTIVAGILSVPIGRCVQKKRYNAIIKKINGKKICC